LDPKILTFVAQKRNACWHPEQSSDGVILGLRFIFDIPPLCSILIEGKSEGEFSPPDLTADNY